MVVNQELDDVESDDQPIVKRELSESASAIMVNDDQNIVREEGMVTRDTDGLRNSRRHRNGRSHSSLVAEEDEPYVYEVTSEED